jgi:hypothetical protein
VNDVADGPVSATRVPEVGDDGGVAPTARRIITPAKFAPVGFTHDNDTDELVTPVTVKEVTGAGAVVTVRSAGAE